MRRSPLVSFMIGNAPFYSCLGTIVQKLLDLHNVVLHSISVIWSISHILKLGHCCVLWYYEVETFEQAPSLSVRGKFKQENRASSSRRNI